MTDLVVIAVASVVGIFAFRNAESPPQSVLAARAWLKRARQRRAEGSATPYDQLLVLVGLWIVMRWLTLVVASGWRAPLSLFFGVEVDGP